MKKLQMVIGLNEASIVILRLIKRMNPKRLKVIIIKNLERNNLKKIRLRGKPSWIQKIALKVVLVTRHHLLHQVQVRVKKFFKELNFNMM